MRLTALWLMPAAFAIVRVLQWVAPFGVDSSVIEINLSTSLSAIFRGAPGRGSSKSPSRPFAVTRLRHFATVLR